MLCVKFEDLTKKAEILILQDETGLSARFSRFSLRSADFPFSPDLRGSVAAIEDRRCTVIASRADQPRTLIWSG